MSDTGYGPSVRTALENGAATASLASGLTSASQADRAKVAELAREFEAYFVAKMIRDMRAAMLDDEEGSGLGAGTMTETMDTELARQITQSGGVGLATVLGNAIDHQVYGRTGTPAATAPAAKDSTPGVATPTVRQSSAVATTALRSLSATSDDAAALPLPLTNRVSSAYGMRVDPFDGTRRFHSGVDIAAAYGKEVPAAGAGQVVFSGAQGGYGNTVVIEHADGIRTRYAHLASIQVEAGSAVDAGTIIGRVGSSGRSTGPHLHFEVLQNGQPVNPEVAATRFAGQLKFGGVVADSSGSQPSVLGVAVGVDDEDSGQ
jgi:murein DD-endopeptidase MepM/ murein hydrolase activator NlpD